MSLDRSQLFAHLYLSSCVEMPSVVFCISVAIEVSLSYFVVIIIHFLTYTIASRQECDICRSIIFCLEEQVQRTSVFIISVVGIGSDTLLRAARISAEIPIKTNGANKTVCRFWLPICDDRARRRSQCL